MVQALKAFIKETKSFTLINQLHQSPQQDQQLQQMSQDTLLPIMQIIELTTLDKIDRTDPAPRKAACVNIKWMHPQRECMETFPTVLEISQISKAAHNYTSVGNQH